jgi:hypothetical protein
MNSSAIPACRHRGEEIGQERWVCRSPRIFAPLGYVSGGTCRFHCPYVDHDGDGAKSPEAVCGPIRVQPRPELFALAMISAPRPAPTVNRTIAEVRHGGFTQRLRVFAEPGSVVAGPPGVEIARNRNRLGMWPNWLQAAEYLLGQTAAPYLVLFEDDLELAACAALALQYAVQTLPTDSFGLATLFTTRLFVSNRVMWQGWSTLDSPPWGSLGYCFSRDSLRELIRSSAVRGHKSSTDTDGVVSRGMVEIGRKVYAHVPSLCGHAGEGNSTVGHRANEEFLALRFDRDFHDYLDAEERAAPPPVVDAPGGEAPHGRRKNAHDSSPLPRDSDPADRPPVMQGNRPRTDSAASLPPVQSLWIGGRLSRIEQLCVASFLALGHRFHLYVYDEVRDVPPGAVVCDAAGILPPDALYKSRSGLSGRSMSTHSNLFRYKLLAERGGWWVDMDVIGLRPLPGASADVAGWEDHQNVNTAVLHAPVGSQLMEAALREAGRYERSSGEGMTGPRLITRLLRELGRLDSALPVHCFYPVHWSEFRRVIEPGQPLPSESYTLHLWNQFWGRNRLDKDARFHPTSMLGQVQERIPLKSVSCLKP